MRLNEALIDHVRAGGGLIGARASERPVGGIVELTFEIDFVLFEMGKSPGLILIDMRRNCNAENRRRSSLPSRFDWRWTSSGL
jgi:hypothetical protein